MVGPVDEESVQGDPVREKILVMSLVVSKGIFSRYRRSWQVRGSKNSPEDRRCR
jgi:hypothetical protein